MNHFSECLLSLEESCLVNKAPLSLSSEVSLSLCESHISYSQPYYSRTSQRDIPSGLFGPLIICSSTVPNDVVGSNLQQKVFIVGSVDETQSWYLEDNLKTYTGIVDTDDPRFAEANAIRGKCSYISFPQFFKWFFKKSLKNNFWHILPDIFFHFLTTFSKRRKTWVLPNSPLFILVTKLEFWIHSLQVMMVKNAIFSAFTPF